MSATRKVRRKAKVKATKNRGSDLPAGAFQLTTKERQNFIDIHRDEAFVHAQMEQIRLRKNNAILHLALRTNKPEVVQGWEIDMKAGVCTPPGKPGVGKDM